MHKKVVSKQTMDPLPLLSLELSFVDIEIPWLDQLSTSSVLIDHISFGKQVLLSSFLYQIVDYLLKQFNVVFSKFAGLVLSKGFFKRFLCIVGLGTHYNNPEELVEGFVRVNNTHIWNDSAQSFNLSDKLVEGPRLTYFFACLKSLVKLFCSVLLLFGNDGVGYSLYFPNSCFNLVTLV